MRQPRNREPPGNESPPTPPGAVRDRPAGAELDIATEAALKASAERYWLIVEGARDYAILSRGGARFWVNEVCTAVRDAEGHLLGSTKISRDLTERRRAEEALRASLAAAEEARAEAEQARRAAEEARGVAEAASRAKSEFLAVMSHELRTPLNAIGGYAQLIELGIHGPVTPEQIAALDRIQRGQQHLLGLINAVLNYAKLEAGHVEYARVGVPVGPALAEVPEKVRQVLLNLLSNAVKFTEPGGTVTLGGERTADGRLALRVADTGSGISADQLERVFQPFVQVDASLTRAQEGTGLGLAISRDLARGMGGDLTAESTPGVGSTFTLTLPAGSMPAASPDSE